MLAWRDDLKVLHSIISLVVVDVVDVLVRFKKPADGLFHDVPMLEHVMVSVAVRMIWNIDVVIAGLV